jgi:type III secretion protein L
MINQNIYKNLIKGNNKSDSEISPINKKVVKNQIISAQNEADKIRCEAEEFANQIKTQARNEAEILRNKAFREGTEQALSEFEINLFESREIREKILRDTEKDLLRLAVRLAEKIIGREIDKDQTTIVDIVVNAVQNVRQQEKLTIRVNPQDLGIIEKEIERISAGSRIKFIDFAADPRVVSGGCMIESEVGTIDARLETQLRVLERALLSQSDGETNPENK